MAKLLLILSYDEVHRNIPYSLVCETHNSACWNTGRRRRAWAKTFSESPGCFGRRIPGLCTGASLTRSECP